MDDVTLRLVVASIAGIILIVASIMGNLGSILGALVDTDHMTQGPMGYASGSGLGSGYEPPPPAIQYPGGAYAPNSPISPQP